jgi:transcriptional regulator GlxA family with amidase domain
MNPYIVARDGVPTRTSNGIWVKPDYAFDDCPQPAIVCIPDFLLLPGERCSSGLDVEVAWLCDCHAAGAMLASACTSAVLLAETGLLNGFDATTHWAYFESLTRHYPLIRVHPNRSLVVSGPGQSIVMGGGATNYLDLSLYLIGRFVGPRAAIEVAKAYVIEWHDVGQQPFASLLVGRQVEDALIRKCQEWAAEHYDHAAPVAAMTKLSGLAERTFIRRFTKATGQSPLEYVHAVRLEEAKQILETEETTVEAIATEVGYEDASFFSHLFRRKVGVTPAQYRKRFGFLRRHLSQPSPSPNRSAGIGLR